MKTFQEIDALRDAALATITATSLITLEDAENALLSVGADAKTARSMRLWICNLVNRKICPLYKTRKALRDATLAVGRE